jgi:hypothetical protein
MLQFAAVGAAGPGNLRGYAYAEPTPPAPLATVLNYGPVAGLGAIANGVAVPICDVAATNCTLDLIVQANVSSVHVVIDVLGFFSVTDLPTTAREYASFFTSGGTPSAAQCDQWNTFRASLSGDVFSGITLLGSAGGSVSCSNDAAVALIVDALANGTSLNIACDGSDWNVGTCGPSIEINTDASICFCTVGSSVLRPCIGNLNWGGLGGGGTCGAPSQNLTLRLEN